MNESKRLLRDQLDELIVWLDKWATFYHNRRPEVETSLRQAVHSIAIVRVFLYGEPT